MNEEGINSLRPLIETPLQVDYNNVSGHENEFIAIKWEYKTHEADNTRSEYFYNICYIDNKGNYHELGSSKVLLEILQDYFQYIGNIDEDSGEISFKGD